MAKASSSAYRYKYSIACCARWEHEDVLEWVSYHKSLGFDHIYLISNDDDPMPTFKVLTPFLFGPDPFVTFKHFPKPHQNAAQQPDIYYYFMKNYLHETEWFTFVDVDEFFVLKNVNNIHSFMSEFETECDSLYFNWVLYGHSGKAERDNESLLLSHTQRARNVDVHTKMITRSAKINADEVLAAYRAGGRKGFWHFWSEYSLPGLRQMNVLHENMEHYGIKFPENALIFLRRPEVSPAILNKAYLAHFQFRSEADVRRRVERGGTATNALWQKKLDDGSYMGLFSGRNDVWDVYLAEYWLRHAGNAYDISIDLLDTPRGRNLAIRKPNVQSSWHMPEEGDPPRGNSQGHANNGIRTGTYGFRTKFEDKPWWTIDLLDKCEIKEICLYNDVSSPEAQARAKYLVVETSENGRDWTQVFAVTDEIFQTWHKKQPLQITPALPFIARYVRLSSAKPAQLQIDEVEIYGRVLANASSLIYIFKGGERMLVEQNGAAG